MPIKRSATAIPLALVPALAAAIGCGPSIAPADADPCLPQHYQQQLCEAAVAQHGYNYDGTWYPHVYSYAPLFYYDGYSRYVASGGRVNVISPSVYSPHPTTAPASGRTNVVRGGFGSIGGASGLGGG